MYREDIRKYDDSVKYEVLVNWLLESLKENYISQENLKKLLISLGIEIKEEGKENE